MKTGLSILLSLLSVFLSASSALAQWTNVGIGIDYRSFTITMSDGQPNKLFAARMAVANTNCIINSMIASNRVAGARQRPSAMATRCDEALNHWGQAWGQRNDVIVAINGSFENSSTATIAGGDIYDGWYATRFGDWGGQMGLVWKFDRSYFIGVCPHYQDSGQTVTMGGVAQNFAGINVSRGANQLILYTPQYNNNTLTDNSGVEVLVGLSTPLKTPTSTVTGTIEQVRVNQGSTLIPFDHLVLSGAGSAATYLQTHAQVGQQVQISQNITLYNGPTGDLCSTVDSRNIINAYGLAQGNFNFLVNGSVIPTDNSGMIIRNPRTFLAYNSTYIFFVVCDGRSTASAGMTSDEMGAFCTSYLAATDAVNMDGGGSSVIVVNGAIKNSPSDGSERAVVNGLMMVNLLPKLVSPAFAANQTVTTSTSANLRLGPGTDYYAFTTIASGTQGTVVSHAVNGVYAKGYYWWKCTFGANTGWIAESTLVPPANAPSISQQPTNQVMDAGGSASFTVVATGAPPLGYQWQKNTVNLSNGGRYSGCTNATLTIANVNPTDAASYCCVVTNTHGTATSDSATLVVTTNAYAVVTLTNIPPLSGDVTNEARAITPDGLWAVGVSGTRGFLCNVTNGNVYNVLDPFNAQAALAAGVCYRTSGGQQQVIVGGMSAGWNADYCFTNGTAFAQVRRDNTYGSSGQKPAIGLANLRASGGGDVFWGAWTDIGTAWEFAAVGKVSGVWQGPSTTVATDKTSSLGTTDFALYGVSAAGRAAGYKGSSRTHYVVDWAGTGTPTTWSFNGLNGTTAGAAYAISTNGTIILGQSPVSGGRSGSWPYKAVVTSASPGVLQSIKELPGFADTVGTSGSAGVPYGCTPDGKYAVGTSYRGMEEAVLWNLSDANPTNWTVTDLTHLAVAGGKLNIFSRLARAYSVGTNATGNLVIAGMGLDTNSPANTRAFVMTVGAVQAPVVPRPTVTISGSYPAGFTFSFQTATNASLTYYLEYTTNLTPPVAWNTIASTPGTGSVASLPDPDPPDLQRFYRVRVQ